MALGRRMAAFNRHVTNRLLGGVATRLPGFGVVLHVGRRSGRPHRTPVNVFRTSSGYLLALTYGSRAEWVRNVLAARGCDLMTRGRTERLVNPRLFRDDRRAGVPAPVRAALRLGRVSEFLELDRVSPEPDALLATVPAAPAPLPRWVPWFNRIARPLLAAGVPMGPDVLITVRGRRTGLPRTTPVTICEHLGRRGLISPFGEVNWVRNLRAAGLATITIGRRSEEVAAVELSPAEAAEFIRDVLAPRARQSRFGLWFVRHIDKIDIDRPDEAAAGRPVFELHQRSPSTAPASNSQR